MVLEPFKVAVLFLADWEQGFELIYPAQKNTWKSRPWSHFYAILLFHEYLNRLCRISWLWQKRLRESYIYQNTRDCFMCCEWSDPYIKKGLDLVHFITLYESLELCIIRQKWKIRLHFSFPKCCSFCLLFQICHNKVFYFRLNKIFCMDPKWLGFLYSKKEKELYKPE